jgi:putative hydrolase of the HAD superfamily
MTTPHIQAVLFDADGVIQRRSPGWKGALGQVLGFNGDPVEFMKEVYTAETPALEGRTDFAEALSRILARWNCRASLDDALREWTNLEVDSSIAATVAALRQSGIACHLATNQEAIRARHMSKVLGYGELFEREFYSCKLGVMKPKGAYFRCVLREIGIPAAHVLFLDDHQVNVDSAREAGLHATVFHLEMGSDRLYRIMGEFGVQALRRKGAQREHCPQAWPE